MPDETSRRPQALVYRGPAASKGCPEAVADLLRTSPHNFEVTFAGPKEAVEISAEILGNFDLYAQAGGPDLDDAYRIMKKHEPAIRTFVAIGGRYLGFCLGGYLAGRDPGFGLLPRGVDTDSEIDYKKAQVRDDRDTVIQVDWTFSSGAKAGKTEKGRWLYFQEGCRVEGLKGEGWVLGRYLKSGGVAASVTPFGKGWVGVVGPHPEANEDWYKGEGVRNPEGVVFDVGWDFVEAIMGAVREGIA